MLNLLHTTLTHTHTHTYTHTHTCTLTHTLQGTHSPSGNPGGQQSGTPWKNHERLALDNNKSFPKETSTNEEQWGPNDV